jgi:hypothetical protein
MFLSIGQLEFSKKIVIEFKRLKNQKRDGVYLLKYLFFLSSLRNYLKVIFSLK